MIRSRKDYIDYRIRKAEDTFDDARLLFNNSRLNAAVNRLYYACFYIVNASLLSKNLQAQTHNGVKTLFFKEFIKTGIIRPELGKLYSDLFDWRQEADYSDLVDFDKESVEKMIIETDNFIKTLKTII